MPGPFDYSPRFGSTYAPVSKITISWQGKNRTVDALIDSGASITCIPEHIVLALSLRKIREIPVSGATTGQKIPRPYYVVDLRFLGFSFPANPVLSMPKRYALIGRDILNQYTTTLDGPALQFSIT